jgi:hypothetical protein
MKSRRSRRRRAPQGDRHLAGEARQDDGEQTPGGRVVERTGGERQGPERRAGETALGDDPRQHREGGDRHRRAHEQRRLPDPDVGGEQRQPVHQAPGEESAKGERGRDSRPGDEDRALQPLADELEIELEADQEHVEDEPDLRQTVDDRQALLGKQLGMQPGRQQTEQRWPEQHAGDHLGDHLRLAERPHQPADQTAARQDDGELQKQRDGQLEVGHGAPPRTRRGKVGDYRTPPPEGRRGGW